jgi:hypothetical protein
MKEEFDVKVRSGHDFFQIITKTNVVLQAHLFMIVPHHHVERQAENPSNLIGQLCLLPCLSGS